MRSLDDQPDPDQQFLDSVFERAVERVEDGLSVSTSDLLDGRDHLRGQVEELVRLARQVAIGPAPELPRLNDYTILSEIGSGGMGTVYLARQERLGGRPVALKILPPSAALSSRARERFATEARAIASLRHPNIVTVHDVIESRGVYAYAMEWVDGKSLAQLIDFCKGSAAGDDRVPVGDITTFLGAAQGEIPAATWPIESPGHAWNYSTPDTANSSSSTSSIGREPRTIGSNESTPPS
ncbi:MAG: protein kinase, partial [Phycisphaerae bacterium]